MADQYCKDTARTTDSTEATGSMASSASPPGLANKFLSSDTSATAMAKFSLDLRDLEAAAVLEALGRVPETQWPVTEASTLELSTDSEVTFRKVLGSAEVLATRPGVDPLEVTRPLPDFSWTSQSPQATSPSVLVRQPTRTSPGPWPPVASHVFGPSTTQVDPDIPYRKSRQTTNWHHTEDPSTLHINDIGNSLPNTSIKLFADDTNLFTFNNTVEDLQADAMDKIVLLNNWFVANKVSSRQDLLYYVWSI